MDLDLSGKYALVTGCTSGISRAIVSALLHQGVTVAAVYPSGQEAPDDFCTELAQKQNGSFVMQSDVSDARSVTKLEEQVRRRLGHVDILVNNASLVRHAALHELSLSSWQQSIDTNLTSVYLVTQAVLGLMGSGGSIINISSNLAAVGMRGKSHYTAAKAGVIGLSRSLCKEVGAQGIRVNTLAPGVIVSEQTQDLSPVQRERYAYLSALGRLGKPEEVAAVVLFLASDLASFITGTTIAIDGGVGGIAAF